MDKRLKKAVLSLARFPEVKWVKLFGSRARGDNQERSDYDLAVCIEGDSKIWFDIQELLEGATILPLDIVDYNGAASEIKKHIEHQGKIIFLNKKWFISLSMLGDALKTLEDIVNEDTSDKDIVRDATLQRFEYTIELFWKTLKHLEVIEGKSAKSPREAISLAYELEWLDDDKKWLQMLKDRNNISHSYNEDLANEIYRNIKDNFSELINTYDRLQEKFIDGLEV